MLNLLEEEKGQFDKDSDVVYLIRKVSEIIVYRKWTLEHYKNFVELFKDVDNSCT